jgi:tetratricopeptide (TPR) repeat protein
VKRILLSLSAVVLAACASTDKPDPVAMPTREPTKPSDPEPVPEKAPEPEKKPEVAVREPTPEEKAELEAEAKAKAEAEAKAKARVGKRSADGIDDETPIPNTGPARDAFLRAVATSQRDPKAAVQQFASAGGQTTYFYAAYYNAGAAAERAGDDREAERQYRKALEVRKGYGPALTNLMLLLKRTGRAGESDRLVDDALAKHGDKSGPHVAAAVRALSKGEYKKVKEEALKAVRIDERDVAARRLMARVFFKQKRYETAKFALENALVLEPGNALLHLDMGHVQLKLDEDDKALEHFRTAARLRPELAEAHENAGVLLSATGDPQAALTAFRANAKLRPKSARAQLLLGNGLRGNKLYKEAEGAYVRALQLDKGLHEARFNLGLLYMDNELPGVDELARLQRAQQELERYAKAAKPRGRLKERLKDYQKSLDRRIKRIERRRKRKAEQTKEAAAEGNPAGGGGVKSGAGGDK